MDKKAHKMIFVVVMLLVSGLFYSTLAQTTNMEGNLALEIKGFGIRHGTPENFPIGSVMASATDQEISGQFTDPFWIEDIQGYITGHYTTIQCEGIYGPSMTKLTGIALKAGSTTPQLLMGSTGNNVHINNDLSQYINITEPITYLYKQTHPSNIGLVNKYADKPWIKILIPTAIPPGVYSGTIVFSFYSY